MKTFKSISGSYASRRRQRGSFLLESLIAMIVLAIGLGGLSSLLIASLYTNHRSSQDTSSTMHTIEMQDVEQLRRELRKLEVQI